ncbi:MAG: IMPACT family protein [Flammeovirgaceae bacterium]
MKETEEDSYLTITEHSTGVYKEKGSKFLAFAYPVSSEEAVKTHIATLKKKYYDARHHCFAYIIGRNEQYVRANDDGEPNNSAGPPILGQIRSKGLINTLVVVVRYFGGTKLGVGGLIHAYKTAASEALEANHTETRHFSRVLQATFEYPVMNGIMKVVKDFDLPIVAQDFNMTCTIKLNVREKFLETVRHKLADFSKVELLD